MLHQANQLHFRPMTVSDLPEVMKIERRAYTAPWSEHSYRYELQNSRGSYYTVATLNGRIIGYCGCNLSKGKAHIMTVVIDPSYHRRGFGEAMFRYKLNEMRQAGAHSVVLEVRESNIGAKNLYRKYGFKEVDRIERFYPDNQEDGLKMELQLNPVHSSWCFPRISF